MPVKRSHSAARVLASLELIARRQPVGVSELSRLLDTDKSAVQRALMTLSDNGWIEAAPGKPTRWRLTGHIHLVAHLAHCSDDLRQRARPVLEALRDESGETVSLTVPDIERFVIVDVAESRHTLRIALNIGMSVAPSDSATARAVLPFMSLERQRSLIGATTDAQLCADFSLAREQGFFVRADSAAAGSINVAAPVFDSNLQAVAAIVLSAPCERLAAPRYHEVGELVARAARALSRSAPEREAQSPAGRAGKRG